jgi:serine/threonine protein kinase
MQNSVTVLNDRYEIIERAGTGGMATVFKGQDLLLGRLVAIKILHEGLVGDDQFLRRFQKEAHSAANLSHSNIVTVHDIGQDGLRYYIVMEYVESATMKEFIREYIRTNRKPLPGAQAIDLAIQICSGVGYAHRAELIHCDIKSQNVLVTSDNHVKVTDFGIARALSEASLHESSQQWGTPQYFSPEQAAGQPPTPASDVYSIGVILFEMLTGRLPFTAESHTALALKHLKEDAPYASEFNPAIPEQLDRIVAKILSKEPAGRYRTANQLGRVLEVYRDSSLDMTGPLIAAASGITSLSEFDTAPVIATGPGPSTEINANRSFGPMGEIPASIHLALDEPEAGTDWGAIALGIVALIMLIGLIPLWYTVYQLYTN